MLVPIKLPPGMFRNGTEYESKGRWYDGSLVRWENGRLKPIGGCTVVLSGGATLTGKARRFETWRDNNRFRYAAVGTHSKLYIGSGGTYTDVTPGALVTGNADGNAGQGYGAGNYGAGAYGTPRLTGNLWNEADTWSFATWGENLECVLTSDQYIWEFKPSTGLVAKVTNAPQCKAVLTTDEFFLMAIAAGGDPRKLQWCDQGANTVWTPTATNLAGSLELQTQGMLKVGHRVGTQALYFTDIDVHTLDYVGAPLVYGRRKLGENCGIIGPNAFAATETTGFWMGLGCFWSYDGVVRPLPCDVQDYIFNDINSGQYAKVYAGVNSRYNEITWFYPSAASIENDRYVTFNYKEKIWYFGQRVRLVWEDRGVFNTPLSVDASGNVWAEETGFLEGGSTRVGSVYAQSGPTEIGNGDKIVYANLLLPDADNGSILNLTAKTRFAPQGPLSTTGPFTLAPNAEGYAPARFAGRQVAVRLDITADQAFAFGTPRVVVQAGGGR